MKDQAFYFGCYGDKGHYLWVRGMIQVPAFHHDTSHCLYPFGRLIDGGFIARSVFGDYKQGRAWLSHVGDWTFLAFDDFSIDSRPQSHSTFVQSGRLGYDEMVAKCKADFPVIWARFTFEVFPAEPSVRPPMKKNVPGDNCPVCTEPEVEASGPRTVYACGSSDSDQRPGTFKLGPRCKAEILCPVCDDKGITNLRGAGHRANAICDGKPRS